MGGQFLVFGLSILFGAVLYIIYFLFTKLVKRLKLKWLKYVFDVVWCGIAFGFFAILTLFFTQGRFQPFTLVGLIIGLGLALLIFGAIKKRLKKKKNS